MARQLGSVLHQHSALLTRLALGLGGRARWTRRRSARAQCWRCYPWRRQLRAEAVAELSRCAKAELPRRAEAAVQLRAEAAVVELSRRAGAANAPRWLEACSQEALKRCRTADCRPWRYRCRWLFRHAVAHREAHDCPAESQCCRCRFSYQRRRYPRCPATARQEACDCREASRCWLRGRLLRPWCPATARREAQACCVKAASRSRLITSSTIALKSSAGSMLSPSGLHSPTEQPIY
jgi:hypothetical protein